MFGTVNCLAWLNVASAQSVIRMAPLVKKSGLFIKPSTRYVPEQSSSSSDISETLHLAVNRKNKSTKNCSTIINK